MTPNSETRSKTIKVCWVENQNNELKVTKINLEVRETTTLNNSSLLDCTDKLAVLVRKHGNRYNPGFSPFSRLLVNMALLAACWPPLCLLLPGTESEASCRGALFSQTHTSIVTLHLILKACLETKAPWLLSQTH